MVEAPIREFDFDKALYTVTPASVTGMNLLIYGFQGAGKTHFAASAQDVPEMADVLLLNIEGGTMTVAERGDIAAVNINSLEQLESIFWMFANDDSRVANFKTIVIDSITELQTLNLEDITSRKPRNKDIIAQDDYGKSTKAMKRILRMFRDLDRHVIYVALPKDKTTNDGNTITAIIPSLTASLSESVQGYMDCVWYLYSVDEKIDEEYEEDGVKRTRKVNTGNKVRRILTQETGLYRGKTRGPKFAASLGNPMEDPTMPKVFEIWKNTAQ